MVNNWEIQAAPYSGGFRVPTNIITYISRLFLVLFAVDFTFDKVPHLINWLLTTGTNVTIMLKRKHNSVKTDETVLLKDGAS